MKIENDEHVKLKSSTCSLLFNKLWYYINFIQLTQIVKSTNTKIRKYENTKYENTKIRKYENTKMQNTKIYGLWSVKTKIPHTHLWSII